jgi:L-lactate utilization protein LutB
MLHTGLQSGFGMTSMDIRSIMRDLITSKQTTRHAIICDDSHCSCSSCSLTVETLPRPIPASAVLRELRKSCWRRIASQSQQPISSLLNTRTFHENGVSRRSRLVACRHESQRRHVRAGTADGESGMQSPANFGWRMIGQPNGLVMELG